MIVRVVLRGLPPEDVEDGLKLPVIIEFDPARRVGTATLRVEGNWVVADIEVAATELKIFTTEPAPSIDYEVLDIRTNAEKPPDGDD